MTVVHVNYLLMNRSFNTSYEPSVHSLWVKTLQNVLLLILNLSIASTSIIPHLMSRSKTALVPLNIPFLETLSIPILRINHHASAGICSHIPAESARVSYSNISLHQWNRYYLQTNTDVRYRSLAPTGTGDAAWMKLSLQPDSVCICCDVHFMKEHDNPDFIFSTKNKHF